VLLRISDYIIHPDFVIEKKTKKKKIGARSRGMVYLKKGKLESDCILRLRSANLKNTSNEDFISLELNQKKKRD